MKACTFLIVFSLALIAVLVPAAGAVDPLWTHPASPGNEFSMLVVSADGSTIVAGGDDQMTALSRDGTKKWSGWSSTNLDISANGRYILSSQAQTVRLFTVSGIMLWDKSIEVPVTGVSLSPDGTIIGVSGANTLRTFFSSGEGIGANVTPGVNHFKVSPAKDQIIVTTTKDVHRVNLSIVPKWYNENSSQDLVDISGDGSSFVTVTYNRAWLFHASGALLWERIVPGGNALALAYSRDGSTIVIGRDDNTVRVLDRNGTLLWTAPARGWVTSVGVSDDGSTIVAGSMDRNLYVFDRSGTLLGSYVTTAPIRSRSVGVSGDGSVIAAADMTAVYGFSREQFEPPAATPVTTAPATPPVTVVTSLPPVITVTSAAPVTATGTTARAALPLTVPLFSVIILAAICHLRDR